MNSFRRRQFLHLLSLAGGASLLPIASHSASDKSHPSIAQLQTPVDDPFQAYMERAEAALAEKFLGITTNGQIIPNLYSIEPTGKSTESIRRAADSLITSLNSQQQTTALFPIDSNEWRDWSNIHRYPRNGISLQEMTQPQKQLAFKLLKVSLSAKGFETANNIMILNEVLGGLTNKPAEYGRELYWFSFMGQPSATEPWGWQFEGHHLIINYFVLGDRVVMTPAFMGSEPVSATEGQICRNEGF